ncbi:DUF4376 domain-containing protein [Janthinobacterium fluminis]|uniref:DUF4376 domain-containing protein n=1 Tax=Janthinobacterium fluminis TaxID=2987524 RepID=A0ABT5JUM0_9BURK|nr:DUF4376 domain-containing protein [Janthinobacterium fluminis]MDC8756269.1 DUF4376 domain-containing protein [Janthinobacterium fluminis]
MVRRIEANMPFSSAQLTVLSYSSEEGYLAGAGSVWSSQVSMPLDGAGGLTPGSVDAWLVTAAGSPFAGGTVVADRSLSLECAKSRRWADIKARRDRVEAGGFDCAGGRYDSDQRSAQRIAVAAQSALAQRAAALPYTVAWILADNSVRQLDGAGMIAVADALAEHVDAAFSTARALRDQVDAAATIEQVGAVQWPAPAQ